MKTSNRGIELIKAHEGFRSRAYYCPAGVPTIGYGHTEGVKIGDVIDESRAESFLRGDVAAAETEVNSKKLSLTQNQFDALVSFTFNVGSGNLRKSTLLRKAIINTKDPSIAIEFRKWNKARVKGRLVVLPGLVKRREDELKLYFNE